MNYIEIIEDLTKKIAQNKTIGNDLIKFLYIDEFEKSIHEMTDNYIYEIERRGYLSSVSTYKLIVALTYIAMKNYSNSLWDHFRNFYAEPLKHVYSEVSIENAIRESIKELLNENTTLTRQIDYLIANSIVPQKHLDDFMEFVFDIYKKNFECSLPKSLKKDLLYIYTALKDKLKREDNLTFDYLENKTYKLVVGTLDIIRTQRDIESLVNFTAKIIEIIDLHYYREDIPYLKEEYYRKGYEGWIKLSKKEGIITKASQSETREKNTKWTPTFKYSNGKIILDTPLHIIWEYENKNINPYSISVYLYNDDNLIYKDNNIYVEKGITILKIRPGQIQVDYPLGKLKYIVKSNETILFDSGDSLYRKNIFFDNYGYEIKKFKNYIGYAYFCYNDSKDFKIKKIKETKGYKLGTSYVDKEEIYYFDNEIACFFSLMQPGINGELLDNVKCECNGKKIDVYKFIDSIVLESKKSISSIGVVINGVPLREDKYSLNIQPINDIVNSIGIFLNLDDGVYSLKLIDKSSLKIIENGEFNFVINKKFEYSYDVKDKGGYYFIFDSGLNVYNNNSNVINNYCLYVENEYEPLIYFDIQKKYKIELLKGIPVYKLDNFKFREFECPIQRKEIDYYSRITVKGLNYDFIELVDENGAFIRNIEIQGNFVPIGSLKNLFDMYNYIFIRFVKENSVIKEIKVYFHAEYDAYNSYISYDSEDDKIKFKINYFGEFKLRIIISQAKQTLYESYSNIIKNKEYSTPKIDTNKKINVKLIEESEELFERDRVILKKGIHCYHIGDLKGKKLLVSSVKYSYFDGEGNEVFKDWFFDRTYLEFLNYNFDKGYYVCKAYQVNREEIFPIYVRIIEEDFEETQTIKVIITDMDGDSILLDKKNNTFLNKLYLNYAPDIISATVELNRRKYIAEKERRKNESYRTN